MTGQEIRQSFIDFFTARNHTVVPSSSVIPWDDPTLLFANAGMNQFKDVFLNTGTRNYSRAVDTQKCIRAGGKHNDLEDVGTSPTHHTFFEMLGNWSFGDYYKEEAILWAWELLTEEWKLPKEKLWASVFRDDDEAETLWAKLTDIDPSRILRFDEKDNFWEMGETGPCGPSSEIHFDMGPERCSMQDDPDHYCGVNGDCGRYMEIWNLVFIQYNRDESGALSPLPARHVDTGMGFERTVSILQHVLTNYDTDIFRPLINRIADMTGQAYTQGDTLVPFRILADHARVLTFAIADGALPSNEGRGYVLRRILRRAARYSRTIGEQDPFLYRLVPAVIEQMGAAYPEIRTAQEHVEIVIKSEEEAFGRTLNRGLDLFEEMVVRATREGRQVIAGSETFKLYDTYGFPADLTQLMAVERHLSVDMAGFDQEMEAQRARSRAGSTMAGAVDTTQKSSHTFAGIEEAQSEFVGYDRFDVEETTIIACDETSIVLSKTPFYAESGGQLGDTGWLKTEQGVQHRIVDTKRQNGVIIHHRDPDDRTTFSPATRVTAQVDTKRRRAIMRNHTATHLLHAALRSVLGTHVQQRGSEVAPDRLRFDFSHFTGVTPEELNAVERKVNEQIWDNIPVDWFETNLEDAKNKGAMALFTEKYGDRVRVVCIHDVSMELCGGTHLQATGGIGSFRLLRESSVAAGERRIEAVTGSAAYEAMKEDMHTIHEVAGVLKSDPDHIIRRAEGLNSRIRELEQDIKQMSSESTRNWLDDLLNQSVQIDGVTVATAQVESSDMEALRILGDTVRNQLPAAAVGVLFARINERPMCLTVVTDAAISGHKLHAGNLARDIASIIGGGGGGKAHMAQAGGKDASKIGDAIEETPQIVRRHMQSN